MLLVFGFDLSFVEPVSACLLMRVFVLPRVMRLCTSRWVLLCFVELHKGILRLKIIFLAYSIT